MDVWQVKTGREESGIDVAFGSNKGTFSGFHRLSVQTVEEGETCYMRLVFSSMTCNPTQGHDRSWTTVFPALSWFHGLYAEVLFRAAVANVVRNLEASGVPVRFQSR